MLRCVASCWSVRQARRGDARLSVKSRSQSIFVAMPSTGVYWLLIGLTRSRDRARFNYAPPDSGGWTNTQHGATTESRIAELAVGQFDRPDPTQPTTDCSPHVRHQLVRHENDATNCNHEFCPSTLDTKLRVYAHDLYLSPISGPRPNATR